MTMGRTIAATFAIAACLALPATAQTICKKSATLSFIGDEPDWVRTVYAQDCKPGEILQLKGPTAVAMWCDMTKPVIQQGRTTVCTMLAEPRQLR